ncbi:DNA-binding GntR family transcriptional regulator [Paenibacillus anaericanus]|uniref:GntR family transcriptional regulator n=1 Tax=Paenibacillus anaericanus TaxID=170367 RepID=UPI00278818C1|nr:GntR family transcriptional regulator [Paenibacillus anaericanus]MDQ0086983.1 DNA-binding GntR family transcriptional regulator [Paenibacillus anaericanus]
METTVSLSRKDKPLYLQIKNILKDRLLYGVYPIGTNIPSEPQLEKEFAVSKITVRNAIQELAQEGYLEKGSGKGTKVIRNTSASKLSKWKRFTEILVEEGYQIQKQWLRAEVIRNEVGTEPYRLFGERCLSLERVYNLNDAPYIHYTHYVTIAMEDLNLSDLNAQSLYELLEEQEISLDKLRDEFTVAVPSEQVGDILRISKGTPVLKRSRYSYDVQGNVIEFSVGYYNTELQNYVVNYDV